eukprot:TRINITY_DN6157_c0_g1_i3.p1 TRINITY_DN6157_c0_g1~~TRINITY_DN6157_c0_g1_i3.p1  ORF type:complete len:379 (-),score=64.66 TRINITY_DN6157_c0_g1_i3:313-1422(-)
MSDLVYGTSKHTVLLKKFAIMASLQQVKRGQIQVDLEKGFKAVRLASNLCKRVQLQLRESETASKNDASPVTIADYGAQALVTWSLQSQQSEKISMVAEEDSTDLRQADGREMLQRITQLVNEELFLQEYDTILTQDDILQLIDLGGSEGGSCGRNWVLDPIDGTRGFVGQRQYAVCLGLLVEGEVEVGVLGCPNLPAQNLDTSSDDQVGTMFIGSKGGGAYAAPLASNQLPQKRIKMKQIDDVSLASFMESYESRHSDHTLQARIAQNLGITSKSVRIDSQCKYGALSRGDGDIFLRFMVDPTYVEKIWDHAAGNIILQEAGGKITDMTGNPLDFSKGRYLKIEQGILAASADLHPLVLKVAKETLLQ